MDDPGPDRSLLETGCGVRRRPRAGRLRVRGADALDYLHRMTSQDLVRLPVGRAALACVLTREGRLVGVPLVWRLPDVLWLDLAADALPAVRERLERYVIADDVTIEDESAGLVVLDLVGPRAPEVVARLVSDAPAPGAHVALGVDGTTARLLRSDLGRIPAFVLALPGGVSEATLARVEAAGGVLALDEDAWDALRVEEGVPAWGAELVEGVMPLEARLEDAAISWSKGCYPGQEPVAKARFRGRPPSRLVRLALVDAPAALAGTTLEDEGRAVGLLTTVVNGTDPAQRRALGYVRTPLAEPGRTFVVGGRGEARVLPWPGERS